jgi:hypothetical protein
MPLRSTERSDGRKRPGWKDGSQSRIGERPAQTTTDAEITDKAAGLIEQEAGQTRDRRHYAEADAGSQIRSRRYAEVCLALLPYGRRN